MVVVAAAGATVEARGRSLRWRAVADLDGALRIDHGPHGGPLRRVDSDVTALLRSATRLCAEDPDAARQFTELAVATGRTVAVPGEPTARAIVRATLPLLAPQPPWPIPLLPTQLNPSVHRALRARSPREAALLLWPTRTTRPLVAALARLLCRPSLPDPDGVEFGEDHLDVFVLTLLEAVGELLQPDQLAGLLATVGRAGDPSPLQPTQARCLHELLTPMTPARITRLCAEAITDPAARARLRHVAEVGLRAPPDRRARSWEQIVSDELLDEHGEHGPGALAAIDAVEPAPAPARDDAGLRLLVVRSRERLTQLGDELHNCLASYGDRLRGADRIVEFRRGSEVTSVAHVRNGRLLTLEGPHNRAPATSDVPIVRRLLVEAGLLTAPAPPRHASGVLLRREDLAQAPLSVQALATCLLAAGDHDDATDWCELGAALWCLGALAQLPDPRRRATRQAIHDVALALAAGRRPRVTAAPSRQEREARHADLRQRSGDHQPGWWQYLVMADVLARPITA